MKKMRILVVALALSALLLLGGAQVADSTQVVYPAGMVSYWRFDEGSGTSAYDCVDANHGTVYGAAWTIGIVNGALSFDGVDDYVATPTFAQQTQGAIEVWFKANVWDGSGGGIISSRSWYGYEDGDLVIYNCETSLTDLCVLVWGSGTWQQVNTPISIGQWYHVAYTWGAITGKKLYLNGVKRYK